MVGRLMLRHAAFSGSAQLGRADRAGWFQLRCLDLQL